MAVYSLSEPSVNNESEAEIEGNLIKCKIRK